MLQYYLAVISLTYPPPLLDTPHNVSPDALPLDSPWDALKDALLDVIACQISCLIPRLLSWFWAVICLTKAIKTPALLCIRCGHLKNFWNFWKILMLQLLPNLIRNKVCAVLAAFALKKVLLVNWKIWLM